MDFFKKHKMLTLLLMLVSLILAPAFLYNGVLEAISVTPGAPDEGAHPGSDLIATGPLLMPGVPEVMISMATLNDWINNGYNNGVPDTFGYQKMAILSVQTSGNYGAGHPTGAYLWDQVTEGVNSFRSDGIISVKFNVLTKSMMDAILQRAGIDADTVIVVTGDNLWWIGRTYFNLRYWGFPRKRLRVANGVLADFPGTLTTVVPAPVGSGQSVCNLSQAASVDEVRASLAEMISVTVDSDPHTVPLDVRNVNEWNGNAAGNVAFRGRMKTAVWNEWKNQTTNGGNGAGNQIKDAASLATVFNGVGITSADTSYIY